MTDRELLERAARAAGMEWAMGSSVLDWNPLEDDGDALRLAVKLGFCVTVLYDLAPPDVWVGYKIRGDARSEIAPLGSDPYVATRRAIVRAAAEMGGKE